MQGILTLNGQVFATGKGPDGLGLYRLEATESETQADKVTTLLKFTGEAAEHGCHAVTLGPDGLLYVVLGNHTQLAKEPAATSPYHHYYEGDLVPKYEDPHGEAVGIKAPCGTIVRTDVNGSFAEIFAGGLRNCYDMAFNRAGELFTWDSDMEWDVGLPWYRPTRLVHATPGAEFGSRSGWSVWPDYYFDGMPTLLDTGRGSPTGMVAYNHVMFPKRYHDALFMGDWSRGRILAIRMKQQGGAYKAETETFATGKPLNVTNLTVGPDGALYFCTGGRDSEGGIYRIVWQGKVPPEYTDFGEGIKQAIRQPQLNSAFARQKIAAVKQKLGDSWDKEIVKWADNPASDSVDRCRALDLMQLFGPFPSGAQLVRLGGDPDAAGPRQSGLLDGAASGRCDAPHVGEDAAGSRSARAARGLRIAGACRREADVSRALAAVGQRQPVGVVCGHAIVGNIAAGGLSRGDAGRPRTLGCFCKARWRWCRWIPTTKRAKRSWSAAGP